MKEKAILAWSGGKDSALSLYEIRGNASFEVVSILTTVTDDYDRISMHGVRLSLLAEQADALGIPLVKVPIPKDSSHEEYSRNMESALRKFAERGCLKVIFGDIFLEDVRKEREEKLSRIGMKAIFPLWKKDTNFLAKKFIDTGFKAIITCVDTQALSGEFVGRVFDSRFLAELPAGVDHCGENGEFHSFVYDGPIFKEGISFGEGEKVLRDSRFRYCDLIPYKEKSVNKEHCTECCRR